MRKFPIKKYNPSIQFTLRSILAASIIQQKHFFDHLVPGPKRLIKMQPGAFNRWIRSRTELASHQKAVVELMEYYVNGGAKPRKF